MNLSMLWALGVGNVISGMYFGWNLGLIHGGTYGLLIAISIVTLMYVTFVMSYTELACAIPRSGGAFIYADRALGSRLGFLAGIAQCIEFIFAPPAIAAAIGAYFHIFFPQLSVMSIAIMAYVVFTALNIYGTKQSIIIELIITVLAVAELLIFAGITAPHFSIAAFTKNSFPHGWIGAFAAVPYAIWFYLGIEGVANVAEETKNPRRDISRAFGLCIFTLVTLALLTFFSSVGVNGWESIVDTDSPLPSAMKPIVGENSGYYHLLVSIGLCGLLASFHGLILVSGRATLEFGRKGYAPHWVGQTLKKRGTPGAALLINSCFGVIALYTGRTSEIIALSVFGALTLYVISMVSLFKLRKTEPQLSRPYLTPGYPWIPAIALGLSLFCLTAMMYNHPTLALIYIGILAMSAVWRAMYESHRRVKKITSSEGQSSDH